MVYSDLVSRSLASVCAAGLVLACNPDKGDDTSGGSTGTTGGATTGGPTTDGPTTGGTAPTTTGATTGEPGTTGTTGDTSDTTGGAVGCGEDPEFTSSWNAWQSAVLQNGDTYWYSVLRGYGGFQPPDFCIYRTLVVVTDGVVVERRFEVSEKVGMPPECDDPFIEQGEQLGTQTAMDAAAPVTVEGLYAACCDEVIHIEPADEYTVNFNVDEEGLMKECFYVANGCADGCANGPLGATLAFENLDFGAPPPAP